jgi:acetyltransferase-like isoleucine patch superfamily enzyme
LYPSVNISGNCRIEEMVSFGVGSSILQKLSVGKNTFVGAGAVVIKSLPKGVVAVGVLARIINETS